MRRAPKLGRPSAVIAALVVGLTVPGVAFAGTAHHALAAEIHVTFTDTRLLISPAGLQPGLASFIVVNRGKKPHILAIKGPGLGTMRTQKVGPGTSATLVLRLVLGAYKLSDSAGLSSSNVRWLVVRASNVVGPVRNATPPKQPPTTAVVPGGMDCNL